MDVTALSCKLVLRLNLVISGFNYFYKTSLTGMHQVNLNFTASNSSKSFQFILGSYKFFWPKFYWVVLDFH